ncbi:galactan beta-1,4-galactosyltransferase GALS2-like [Carica papaya]|uniref:galactan beta-1,4-galactosyltransferase GALS2-like n=1 Tax=Carica papaya TaxID=3649 RepID=UPI000B8C7CB0|nr:galactan beta-1,4-galactosyltransferase GALS2-like [Carica papaya]
MAKEKKMLVGFVWNYAAELKIMLTALLVLCTVATVLQFISSTFSISTSDLRLCISRIATASTNISEEAPPLVPPSMLSPPSLQPDQVLSNGVIKRSFIPYGAAAYNFISMSAYRGGLNTFTIIGLSSKPLHVYGRPSYPCQWVPEDPSQNTVTTAGNKMLPDWGYGRVYTAVVIRCAFPAPINANNSGGKLLLHASTSGGGDTKYNSTDIIETLREPPGSVDFNVFNSPPKYDYWYCGASLYGNLSPQRLREWIAYHVRLFGERSHFVLHDAGGVHEEVMEVLKPWMELGYVTLQDIREQERFDGYYHNQFMVMNDCLHRYKFMAKWMFFFDVDEFIYVQPKSTVKSVLDSMQGYSQFTIEQRPMSSQLCYDDEGPGRTYRKWGFEKLVYRDVKKVPRRDRKYAVQPRRIMAAGVHLSQHLHGKTYHSMDGKMKYFHYHGSISQRREPCRHLFNTTQLSFENNPYILDTTLREAAGPVKKFELKMIGSRLHTTRQ